MTDSHSRLVRAYGYAELGTADQWRSDEVAAVRDFRAAIEENAGLSWPFTNLAHMAATQGHPEEALRLTRQALALTANDPGYTRQAAHEAILQNDYGLAVYLDDHATALVKDIALSEGDNLRLCREPRLAETLCRRRPCGGPRRAARRGRGRGLRPAFAAGRHVQDLNARRNRRRAERLGRDLARKDALQKMPPHFPEALTEQAKRTWALAHLGRVAEAHAVIDPTPLDCQPCVVARGGLAQRGRAVSTRKSDHWFAEASRIGPSMPNAPLYWGQTFLARGDFARAAVQFREAVRRSPRAEEALEGLGEALAAQGDISGAVKQYAAANALTPKWGRLHLKWGEVLTKLGKRDEALAQFKAATTMDLTPTERTELAAQKT